MLFNFKPSKKLACLTLAASIFASHSTAISIKTNALSNKSSRLKVVNCVTVVAPAQVSTDAHSHSVVISEGEQIPVRIDISRCDPALAGSAQPWTVSLLGRSERHNAGSDQRDLIWIANVPQSQGLVHLDAIGVDSGAPETEYYIRVSSLTQDSQTQLVGQSDSFSIAPANAAVRKRDDYVPTPPKFTPDDGVDDPISAPPASGAPTLPSPDTSGVGTTFPNVPNTPVNPAEIPVPLNPPVEGVVFPSAPEPTPQPGPSKGAIFMKYAGAGAAILSTIGVGVGGLVGGAVGGTVGLVLGLVAAGVNTVILG